MKAYSREEDEVIKKFAGKITTSEIAAKLGRTRAGVAQRALAINVSLKQIGQFHYNAKLSDKDVDLILELEQQGVRGIDIHRYHVSHVTLPTIYDVLECNTWRHK